MKRAVTTGTTVAEVVVYTRQGCKLCQAAEEIASRVVSAADELRFVDIDSDAQLYDRYTVRVPVVTVNGREIAELQIYEEDLRAVLGR